MAPKSPIPKSSRLLSENRGRSTPETRPVSSMVARICTQRTSTQSTPRRRAERGLDSEHSRASRTSAASFLLRASGEGGGARPSRQGARPRGPERTHRRDRGLRRCARPGVPRRAGANRAHLPPLGSARPGVCVLRLRDALVLQRRHRARGPPRRGPSAGLEPLEGFDGPVRLDGPARLCRALGITGTENGSDLTTSAVRILDAPPVRGRDVARGPRIGVDYAEEWAEAPLRFWVRGSPGVSRGRPSRQRGQAGSIR